MPNAPVTWRDEQTVNTVTTGFQSNPQLTQLANGNILVTWTSTDDTGAGSSAGTDIIGQVFDPLGNRIGAEFRVNVFANASDESDLDIAALPDGGFVVAYERLNGGIVTICLDEYNSSGVQTNGTFIVNDVAGDPAYRNPSIAVSSGTSVLVTYEELNAGVATVQGRIYNPSTNAVGSQISLIAFSGGDTDSDVTALSNGNYVITATHANSGDNRIIYRIVDPTGLNVLGVQEITGTGTNTQNDREASVAALTGGGFVISWTNTDTNDTDVQFRVYNSAGTQTGSGDVALGSSTNNNNESVVVALADGTFNIVYDNDENDTVGVEHFSATGGFLGATTFAGSATAEAAIGLADGRMAVAWDNFNDISLRQSTQQSGR
jgi:hypothetical protein